MQPPRRESCVKNAKKERGRKHAQTVLSLPRWGPATGADRTNKSKTGRRGRRPRPVQILRNPQDAACLLPFYLRLPCVKGGVGVADGGIVTE